MRYCNRFKKYKNSKNGYGRTGVFKIDKLPTH